MQHTKDVRYNMYHMYIDVHRSFEVSEIVLVVLVASLLVAWQPHFNNEVQSGMGFHLNTTRASNKSIDNWSVQSEISSNFLYNF